MLQHSYPIRRGVISEEFFTRQHMRSNARDPSPLSSRAGLGDAAQAVFKHRSADSFIWLGRSEEMDLKIVMRLNGHCLSTQILTHALNFSKSTRAKNRALKGATSAKRTLHYFT